MTGRKTVPKGWRTWGQQDYSAAQFEAEQEAGVTGKPGKNPIGQAANNRAENAYLPVCQRERKRQRFKSHGSAPLFLSIDATVYDTFNLPPHLICRTELGILRAQAHEAWANATAAA